MLENIDWFDFLVGGVVVSFFVNIAANLAQPRIESWWGKYNTKRRNKNEAKKQAFDEIVEKLINDQHEELVARTQLNKYTISSTYMAILGLTMWLIPFIFQLEHLGVKLVYTLVGGLAFMRSGSSFSKRYQLEDILNTIDKKKGRLFL